MNSTLISAQKRPNKTEKPRTMSQTMWTNSRAWGAEPPLPTSQNPNLATLTPAHCASGHPHQYVTPSTPQTGSGRKQFTGHMAGDRDDPPQASPEGLESVGILMMAESRSDRTVGKEQRMMKTVRTSKMRGAWDFANLRSMIKEAANPIQSNPLVIAIWGLKKRPIQSNPPAISSPNWRKSLQLFPQIKKGIWGGV